MKKRLSLLFLLLSLSLPLQAQESPTPSPLPTEAPPALQESSAVAVPEVAPTTDQAPSSTPASPSATPSPTPPDENQPAPYPTTPKTEKAAAPKAPRVIPKTFGDTTGEVFIGQRTIIDRYAGWGWIKKEKEGWNRSRWTMLEEKPGVMFAPGRYLGHPDRDNGTQYKLYGQWASYKGYEPNFDVFVDVFQIKGFEVIGPADIPKMSPPRSSRGKGNGDGPYQRRGGVTR